MEISTTTEMKSELETMKKELFDNVMKGEWEKVVKIYEKERRTHTAKITRSGHTALHVAVSDIEIETVEKLVELIRRDIPDDQAKQVLELRNDTGHTSLHVAAMTGNLRICQCITAADKSLAWARTDNGETPLFRAVHYGRRRAFLYLHSILGSDTAATAEDRISWCTRSDGRTILHHAIVMENFDLAFMIIQLYKELVNCVDKEGDSPLHALATKPAAFESGSQYQGLDKIIYKCISVAELNENILLNLLDSVREVSNEKNPSHTNATFPVNFVGLLCRNGVRIVTGTGQLKKESVNVDIENREVHTSANTSYYKNSSTTGAQGSRWSPANCIFTLFNYFINLVCKAMLIVFGYGNMTIMKLRKEKEKRVWAAQLLDQILNHATMYDNKGDLRATRQLKNDYTSSDQGFDESLADGDSYDDLGDQEFRDDKSTNINIEEQSIISVKLEETRKKKRESTAILIAASYGVVEIVEKILKRFPVAVYDSNTDNKNIFLLAVENRHLRVYKLLLEKYSPKSVVFQKVDKDGNTALHFAAMFSNETIKPWPVPGAALQMQWEIKWYEFVENTMPPRLFLRTNKEGLTPKGMFTDGHKPLVKAGGKWLTSTATSCSVVATLIATVAFASSNTVPGGTDSKTGKPNLKNNAAFKIFAISSLVALCFSVTSLITFLAILTSRHQEKDFGKDLPRKILLGLTSLFVSIASVLTTFCLSHFLVFEDEIKYEAFPVYGVTLLPLCLFAAAQFPLYFDIFRATFWSPF